MVEDLLDLDTAYMFMPAFDAVREQLAIFDQIERGDNYEEDIPV